MIPELVPPHQATAQDPGGARRFGAAPPEALFIASALAQYSGAVVAKGLFDEVPPATVAMFRVIGAALALVLVSRAWRQHWDRASLSAAALFGSATAVMNLFFYLAIDRLPLGKGVAIEFIGPVAVAAMRTRTRRNATAVGLAAAGVLVLSGVEIRGGDPLGLVFILLASAMWADYIVVGMHVARLDRGLSGLGVGLVVGALVIAPFGAPGSGTVWTSPRLLALCMVVGVFSSAIGYGIDQSVMRRVSTRRFAVLLALLPVTALAIGWVALDQHPGLLDLLGVGCVLGGVVLQERDASP